MKARITKRLVDGLEIPPKGKRLKVYDDKCSGFGLAVMHTGRKAFFIEYGPKGKRRRMTLGPYGVLTVDQARDKALLKLGVAVQGGDPLAEREAARQMPTLSEWIDSYLADVKRRKKPSSFRDDLRHLRRTRELWGNRPLDAISVEDARRTMAAMGEAYSPIQANRWLASVRACLSAAWRADLIESNPALKVRLNPENPPRQRVLSDDELARVLDAIEEEGDANIRGALLLLVATGARRGEVLQACWEDFDLAGAIWRVPSPKAGRPQVIPLHADTVAMLRELPRIGPWFLPGRNPEKHRYDLKRPWNDVKTRAGIPDIRLHDLRRTFGLTAARTAGLHVASKLLRHSDVRVTEQVYTPLGLEDLRAGLDKVASARAKVIPFKRRRKDAK